MKLCLRSRRILALATAITTTSVVAIVSLGTAGPSAAAVAATADWQFQGTRASAVAGAPNLTDIGTGNRFVTATVDGTTGRKVMSVPLGNGLQVSPLTGLVSPTVYTVAFLFKPLANGGYQRLTDFENGSGADIGLYNRGGQLVAYPSASGTTTPLTDTAFHQVVLTRAGNKLVTGYVDGVKQFSFTDSSDQWLADGGNIKFFKDDASENGAHQVARIRMFKSALSAADVRDLDRLPTNAADLTVGLTDAPDPVKAGALLAYTATVTNNGPAAAAGASVSITFPSGSTFVGSSPSVGTCSAPAARKVTCTLGTLAPSATATALVVVKAPAATGSVTGLSSVSATTADSNSNNNSVSVTTVVR